MSSRRIIGIFFMYLCIANAQKYCAKIDFNRQIIPEFRECFGKPYPVLTAKEYRNNPEIRPYRSTSRYFLGTEFDLYSCLESTSNISMNGMTRIEAPIYSKLFSDAFIEITVYDANRNMRMDFWRIDTSNGIGWSKIPGVIRSIIPNARIEILVFMNPRSVVGIEYIHILNQGINTPDCSNVTVTQPPPTIKPPTSPATVPTRPSPTSTMKPPSPAGDPDQKYWWIIIIVISSTLLAMIFFIGIYCLIESRRRKRTLECTSK